MAFKIPTLATWWTDDHWYICSILGLTVWSFHVLLVWMRYTRYSEKKTPNMSISSSVDGLFVSICGAVMDWGTVESSHQYNGPRKTNMNHIHFTCFIKTNYDCHEPLLSLWFMTIPRTITVLCCVYFIQIYCLESHFKILEGNILCVTSGSNSSFA